MLKWFNKKKKDNKGFTLVELIIVIAILAILVGLLAPQYVKYVEKSRQSADVSNLESIVEGFKVAAADVDYNMVPADGKTSTYVISVSKDGTTVTATEPASDNWKTAIQEYTGYDFSNQVKDVKLKSSKWVDTNGKTQINATVTVESTGAVTVAYDPTGIKDKVTKNPTNNGSGN